MASDPARRGGAMLGLCLLQWKAPPWLVVLAMAAAGQWVLVG